MGLLQLFSLSFQNKLVAACVQRQKVPRIFVFPSNLHYTCSLCTWVCLKHFGHFLRWCLLGWVSRGVTTPALASWSPFLWPLRVLDLSKEHCINSRLPAFQDMGQATGEATQIMLERLFYYSVSLSLLLSVTSFPQLTLSWSNNETKNCVFACLQIQTQFRSSWFVHSFC